MFQRVLVPLDGSLLAEQALPVAARLVRANGGSLSLVRVVSPPTDYSGGLSPVPLMSEQIFESEMKEAADYLAAIVQQPLFTGISIATEALYGFPAQQIGGVATTNASDLIILCSHGRTGFARWALGSVAYALVHQSKIPVLVLRQNETLVPSEMGRAFRTLVPLDGSPLAEAALVPALALTEALAAPGCGVLHLAQVVKLFQSTAAEGFVSELNEEALRLARSYLSATIEHMKATGIGNTLTFTSSVELASNVASTLLGVAEQEGSAGCDLIAISTHGRHGLERWVMGSVTERLLNTSKLPILIVRPPKQQ